MRDFLSKYSLYILVGLLGACVSASIGLVKLRHMQQELFAVQSATQTELTSTHAQLQILKDHAWQIDENNRMCQKTLNDDLAGTYVRTILADQKHPDVVAGSLTILGRQVNFSSAGPVWVIPRRVTPVLQNDAQGGIYGYVGTDGQLLDGWHIATKAR